MLLYCKKIWKIIFPLQVRWWLLYAKNTLHVLNVYIFRFSSIILRRRPCLTWVRLPVTTRVQFSREAVKLWVNSKADRALVCSAQNGTEKSEAERQGNTTVRLCASLEEKTVWERGSAFLVFLHYMQLGTNPRLIQSDLITFVDSIWHDSYLDFSVTSVVEFCIHESTGAWF